MKTQKWPNEILLIRHGQSARNVMKDAAKAAGKQASYADGVRDQDTPLTDVGLLQAEAVGRWLGENYTPDLALGHSSVKIDAFFVSPYLRTRQTAERIIHGMGYPIKMVSEERVREIEFGILDGLTPEGIRAKYPEEVARRAKEGKYWYRAPGGESRPDVKDRLRSFLDTLCRDYREQRIVVICHSVVVLAFRSLLERWGEDQYLIVDKENDVLNCGITRYVYTGPAGKLQIRDYNRIVYSPGYTRVKESILS